MAANTPNHLDDLLGHIEALLQAGEIDSASTALALMRSDLRIEEFPDIAGRINTAEGCLSAYRGDWVTAKDKLLRALALSKLRPRVGQALLAEAWLAYVEFNMGELQSSADRSRRVIDMSTTSDTMARFRSATVLASLYHLANLDRDGERWFNFGRKEAEKIQNTSLTSALMFDMVAMRVCAKRFNLLFRGVPHHGLEMDLLFARSSQNFDRYGGVSLLSSLHSLLEGQILCLLGHYQDADMALDQASKSSDLPGVSRAQAQLEAIYVKYKLGALADPVVTASSLSLSMSDLIDDDDLAVYATRASEVLRSVGLPGPAAEFQQQGTHAASRFMDWQREFGGTI